MSEDEKIIDDEFLIETVENQLQDGDPIKVKETLMRLVMTGHSREDAVASIACALSIEIYEVMMNNGQFNIQRYSKHLDMLPELNFMEGQEGY
jgi:uncharacterized protein YhfF